MNIIIDMNLSPRWEQVLSANDLKATHWSKLGRADALDVEIMDFAREADAVVFTHDLDFSAILAATGQRKPSVVQLRAEDTSPGANAGAIVSAFEQCASELAEGALVTVDPARVRISLLPLNRFG